MPITEMESPQTISGKGGSFSSQDLSLALWRSTDGGITLLSSKMRMLKGVFAACIAAIIAGCGD